MMKRSVLFLALTLAAGAALRAGAAQLKIMEPLDKSVVRGTITFRVKPELAQTDQFLSSPEISIQDEYGTAVQELRAARDPKTGICSVAFDTTKVKDGRYEASVTYRTLFQGRAKQETRETVDLGVRNGPVRPARFVVELEEKQYAPSDTCEVTVKVHDQRGRLMPAARVTFKVDKGEVDSGAELTDSEGEAYVTVDSDEARQVTLTIAVENLQPVTRKITFVE
jgi:hypothetical protein